MPKLPEGTTAYKSTPVFTDQTVPKGLLASHRLKPGAWGRIRVLRGQVAYVLEDDANHTIVLSPSIEGIVAPERPHHIEPEPGSEFQIDFMSTERLG